MPSKQIEKEKGTSESMSTGICCRRDKRVPYEVLHCKAIGKC